MATAAEISAYSAIVSANWSGTESEVALAVAIAESGLNPKAKGGPNSNGTYDWGLFQINDIHKPTDAEKTEPVANAKRAKRIYDAAGGKFTPWSAYNSGAYKAHLSRAKQIRAEAWQGIQDQMDKQTDKVTSGAPSLNPVDQLAAPIKSAAENFLGFLNIGFAMVLGIALAVLGIVLLSRGTVAKVVAGTIADMQKKAKAAPKAAPKQPLSVEQRAARSLDLSEARKRLKDERAQQAAFEARNALRERMRKG